MDDGIKGAQLLPSSLVKSRGIKRVADDNSDASSSRRRTSARDVLPIDDEVNQYFPCPVANCEAVYHNRAERSYHIRTDHVGYKYKAGDGVEKIRPREEYAEEEEANLDVEDHSNEHDLSDGMGSYAVEQDAKYMHHQMPQLSADDGKNPSWAVAMDEARRHNFMLDHSEKGIPSGIAGGQFTRDDEIYRRNILTGPRRRGRPKNPPGTEPAANSKVRIADPNGKYRCYIPECPWKGGYRSIRAEHMKWVHKDWQMPPRYVLQRMSRDPTMVFGKEPEGDFGCLVDGCLWRGNYRASRSSHMRSQHPEWQPAKKKAPSGGYLPDGKYICHDPNCPWRGASRSTRAAHMKRNHPGFLNPMFQPKMLLCPDCNVQCCTHKTFVDHLVIEHRIGGSVQREFNGIQDYEEWYEAVQDVFSIEFIKKVSLKQNEDYHVTYLYCARSGCTRPKQIKAHPYLPQYMKQKNLGRPYRARNHCAAFLRVVHWRDGKLSVQGCVEHTGHRLGTVVLRLSPAEREIMDEFVYLCDDDSPMEHMLDKFREMENYVVKGFHVDPYDETLLSDCILDKDNELRSLKLLVESPVFPPNSISNVSIPEDLPPADAVLTLSLIIMTEEMQQLWKDYGSKVVCFEEVRLMIGVWNLALIFVLVFAEDNSPRCCCVYIANTTDRLAVLKRLYEISPQPPQALITDNMTDWAFLLHHVYGEAAEGIENLTADWHLLAEWATNLDNLVANRVDRFTIFACLRRWLRVTDPQLFDSYVVEMFEAFRELGVEEMTQCIDQVLVYPENAKRWNPLLRTIPLTEHSNPTVDLACRNFRDRYLNAENCTRLDQYVTLLMTRIPEFNKCVISQPVAHGTIEPQRPLPVYDLTEPTRTVFADGTVLVHHPAEDEMIMPEVLHENDQQFIMDDEKNPIIGGVIHEEIVEDFPEEMEGEEIVEMVHEEDQPSTSAGMIYQEEEEEEYREEVVYGEEEIEVEQPEHLQVDIERQRKERVARLMQTIQKNPNSLNDHHLHLLESSLSQVVEQLKQPPQ